MKTFKFYLVKFPNKKKSIEFKADNTEVALYHVKRYYIDWDISMFWPVWP